MPTVWEYIKGGFLIAAGFMLFNIAASVVAYIALALLGLVLSVGGIAI